MKSSREDCPDMSAGWASGLCPSYSHIRTRTGNIAVEKGNVAFEERGLRFINSTVDWPVMKILLSSQLANQLWPGLSGMGASRRAGEHRHQAKVSQTHSEQGSSAVDGAGIKP